MQANGHELPDLIEAKTHHCLLKFKQNALAQADHNSMRATLHFLRPCLRSRCRPLSVNLRFHEAIGIQWRRQNHVASFEDSTSQKQLSELSSLNNEAYPRILASEIGISCQDFVNNYEHLERSETINSKCFIVRGMFVC